MIFFFSSRRRHTRCGRDWSSDVCSSDLDRRGGPGLFPAEAVDEDGGGPEPEMRLERCERVVERSRSEGAVHRRPDEPPAGDELAHAPAVGEVDALGEI